MYSLVEMIEINVEYYHIIKEEGILVL